MNLQGKVALVTGGARRLGRGIVQALAERGCDVVVHFGSSSGAAERTVDELASLGVRAWRVSADLTRAEEIDRMFAFVNSAVGRLDVLVNSAASFESAMIDTIDAEAWDRVQALNLRAPFLCLRRASERMRESSRDAGESAAVINIADWSGLEAWPGFAHHGVSKAGLIHLTRVAARELAPAVRVNAVVPGAILPAPGVDPESDEWLSRAGRIPRGRTGEPQDVGRAVVFLAEHEFVTGVVLPVDGGEGLC
jgi:NAD(P)-dependent dehydrogenase (short-subunit alcohol dehydrogenase family)